MTYYIAGFATALLLFVVAIVAYFVKTKPLREQVSQLEAKIKIKEILHDKFKKAVLGKSLPTSDADILKRFRDLNSQIY